ncbi:NAD(P)H-dependent oxidoreductase [uncultured Chitinophaga sp.]|uniref:NAD(P)H-dependent oxidoreductase n=1 Tax=uncultured Chitinophaga sp. TaxID=339340 RepID=UPI00260C4D55|nr:NAD(P)H-dependent oxidoreductase [uncultured Chitinophaga sp.]
MGNKNILVILGHPDSESFCGALADAYINGASAAGHTVRVLRLGEMVFNPDLHHGYSARTPWEPALETAWADIQWSEHMVWVYPTWWGTIPALMKGFIDRVFLPGKAFKYREKSPLWDKFLKGKSARLITTMDSPLWYNWLVYHNAGHRAMKHATLKFCGVHPVKITAFGKLRWQNDATLARKLQAVELLGRNGK